MALIDCYCMVATNLKLAETQYLISGVTPQNEICVYL